MPLYAAMAALGSLLGCVLLFFLARKAGEAFFHAKAGHHAHAIRHWVENNGFGGVLVAALLPPPTPFKFFVLAAGGVGRVAARVCFSSSSSPRRRSFPLW